jgi:hypothetical protein
MEKSEAIAKWSELYDKPISESEYEEICHNLNVFFKILCEWDKEDKRDS